MRIGAVPLLLVFLLAEPAAAQRYRPAPDALAQPLTSTTERLWMRAQRLSKDKEYAAAIKEFDKVLALQPNFAFAMTERAFARERVGDYEGAMADYDEALRLAPNSANAWSHKAWIRALRNFELDAALTYSERAIAIRPGVDPVDTRGFVFFRRGEWDKALSDYNVVLKAYPRSATTLFMRGVVKIRMGDQAGGEADLQRARKLDKNIEGIWLQRGVTP